ncbi:MAG: glycosyltransferase family 39 protein [Bacteroidales bacterium]|nr:glycosyltransferase family 39 protein [Bacteroidales bacterium]
MEQKSFRVIPILGIGIYLISLLIIDLVFRGHAMEPIFHFWGVGEVLFFFVFTCLFYQRWKDDDPKRFWRKVFFTALGLRVLYAFLTCYYFYYQTGIPFEYDAADSLSYHKKAVYLSHIVRAGYLSYPFKYLFAYSMGFSDSGYTLWLTLLYSIFGPNVLVPRLLKALMSAYMCIAIYKLTSRTFDEKAGRLAAVMSVFMPIFIQITGLHLKECEMIFLSVMALERMDYLIRSKKYTFWNVFFPILLVALTFGFRTITGMCLIFAFFVFIVLSTKDLVPIKSKIIVVSAIVVLFFVFLFTPIGYEMRIINELKFTDIDYQSEKFEKLGMEHAELAKNIYVAPAAFVMPVASMVDVSNDSQKLLNGSVYVKNFIAFFAMLAIVIAFRERKWRNFSLIGAYELSYLAIIMFSFAFNSERYHEPAIPMMIVMAAYAVTRIQKKDRKFFYIYCGLLLVALVGWNWMKLSARGLI